MAWHYYATSVNIKWMLNFCSCFLLHSDAHGDHYSPNHDFCVHIKVSGSTRKELTQADIFFKIIFSPRRLTAYMCYTEVFFSLSYTKAYVGSAPCEYYPAHTFNPFYSWISTPPRCITQPLLDTEWHHTPHTLADSRLLAPQHPAPSHAGWNCLTSASHTLYAAQEHHLWVVWCYFLLPRQQSS